MIGARQINLVGAPSTASQSAGTGAHIRRFGRESSTSADHTTRADGRSVSGTDRSLPAAADVESVAGDGAEWPVLALPRGFAAVMNNFSLTSIRRARLTYPPPMTSSWCAAQQCFAAEPNRGLATLRCFALNGKPAVTADPVGAPGWGGFQKEKKKKEVILENDSKYISSYIDINIIDHK